MSTILPDLTDNRSSLGAWGDALRKVGKTFTAVRLAPMLIEALGEIRSIPLASPAQQGRWMSMDERIDALTQILSEIANGTLRPAGTPLPYHYDFEAGLRRKAAEIVQPALNLITACSTQDTSRHVIMRSALGYIHGIDPVFFERFKLELEQELTRRV